MLLVISSYCLYIKTGIQTVDIHFYKTQTNQKQGEVKPGNFKQVLVLCFHLNTETVKAGIKARRFRVRYLKFARNLKFATSKTLINFMKRMMFCLNIGIFQFKKP